MKPLIEQWKEACLKDTVVKPATNLNEGWTGDKANKAYDQMLEVFENMSGQNILDMLWSWLDSDTLEKIYGWMKEEEYILDDEEDEENEN